MRHRRRVKHFSRKSSARIALIRGLVESLVLHGRIATTVEKAREVRRHVEKAITIGKKGTVAAHRLVLSRYPSAHTAEKIMKNISPRFKSRSGGYTRIIKIGRRAGDTAEMAFLEFVDFVIDKDIQGKSVESEKTDLPVDTLKVTRISKVDKNSKLRSSVKRKSIRKLQNKARQASRV